MIPLTTGNVVALTIQAAVLVLVGAPLPRLLGVRSPRARLAYWRALLLACLLLPLVQPWLPDAAAAAPILVAPGEQVSAVPGAEQVMPPASVPGAWMPGLGVLDLVAAGIIARFGWFLVGLFTLARVRRQASLLDPRPSSVEAAVGLARADAEFRVAASPARPVTFGLLRPVVVVPSDFAEFAAVEQKAIACHELIHVRRRDWGRNIGDEIVRAVAWFHPAAWWLTRQIRLSREQLVDQEVVRHLGARKPYLDALLRLASPDRGSVLVPAPLFLGRTHLSDRIALLVKEVRMSRPRLALSFLAMAIVLFLSGRAIVAAVPLHSGVAAMAASQAQAPGQQAVGAAQPGQMTTQPAAERPAQPLRRIRDLRPAFPPGSPDTPLVMSVKVDTSGSVSDVTAVAGPPDLGMVASDAIRQWRFSATPEPVTMLVGFNPAAGAELRDQPPVLIGGTVRPPVKIKDVKPVYPADARDAHVQGVVILETRIAADGSVAEARVLRSIAMLDRAAMAAVLQWKFASPGFPVQMTVTVNFTLRNGPADAIKRGIDGGVAGGVAGGVSGGVAGGVQGGVAGAEKEGGWISLPNGERAMRVGGAVKPPQRTLDVKPLYPKDAQEARVQGVVIIEAMIGPDGKVTEAKVLRSVALLDEAALDAVKQWEFAPTIIDGKAVSVVMTVTVNFTLE